MTNDKLRIHVISGNGMRRNRQGADGPKDRTQLLKYASFYLVVAVILLVTNQAAKNAIGSANQSQSLSNLHIDLSVARKSRPDRLGSNATVGEVYFVRFRLANQGSQPIFYPVSPGTNDPIGQIVYRIAPGVDWKPLSAAEVFPSTLGQQNDKARLAWVEMPPGGWAEGEFEDPGSPAGDHAIEVDVKVATDGKANPLLSRAYSVNSN
jgi:hypothetical protein